MNKQTTKLRNNNRYLKLLLSMCLIFFFTTKISAQNISLSIDNATLKSVFEQIEKQSPYRFSYIDSELPTRSDVSVYAKDKSIETLLSQVLQPLGLSYTRQGNNFAIKSAALLAAPAKVVSISGVVKDAQGQPIIGATVRVVGTTIGTTTNVEGSYQLRVPSDAKIQISYIGYITAELPVNNRSAIDVSLLDDTKNIEEVVVIGYGVQNRRDVSTSISSVKSDQLENIPISDFRQGLSGKMAGVQVSQNSGDPEGNVSIRVRGITTVTAGSEPLYVIDGVPMQRGLANLNTNDIESVEILKDASSAAIYGSRGSNGVVIITTKKGKSDKLIVKYDGYYGVNSVSKKIAMMDAYQFALSAKDGHDNAYLDLHPGASADDPNSSRPESYSKIPPELFPYLAREDGLTNTDWQDAIFRTSSVTSHNISLAGKVKTANYFISGNYYKNNGIIINSDFEKYSARFNLDGGVNKFKYGVNFAPSYSISNRVNASGVNGVVQSALMMPPVWPVYNDDGSYNYQGNGYWRIGNDYQHNAILNPVAMARLQSDVVTRMSLVGKVFASYEFIKGLKYEISLGGEYYGAHNDKFRPTALPQNDFKFWNVPSQGEGYSSSGFYFNWVMENMLTYTTTINKDHNISAILVQSAQKETYNGNSVTAVNYPNDNITTIAAGTVSEGTSSKTQWSLASYLARTQYSYKGRYMLSAAIRMDGSSRFGRNNRWGYFPSASAAWRISDEPFFKSDVINDLKLRVSYGATGNFNIGNYDYIATMSTDDYVLGGNSSTLQPGYKPDKVNNDDLRWEKSHMTNSGFDILMFNGFLSLTADCYNTNTSDMLLTVPIPNLTGSSSALMNVGKVNNKGFELQLSSQQDFQGDWGYTFSSNFSKNINTVKNLGPENTPIIESGTVDHAYYITQVGGQIGSYYVLVQDGIFATSDQLKRYPHFDNTRVGDFRFVDVDKDGVLDLNKDRTVIGNYLPKFTYGFSGTAHFRGFDFAFNFQGVYGNKILNLNRRFINSQEGNVNGTIEGNYRWRSETEQGNGQINRGNRKATGYNSRVSTFHIEDGSYLRLQNIALGYTLPSNITKKFYVEKLRVYASAQNLLTFTKYSGYNPEVNNRPSSSVTPGEDYGTYPLAQVVTFGLNVTF